MGTVVCNAVGGQGCNAAGNSVSAGLTNVWTAANTVSSSVSAAGGITGIGLAILSYVILIIAILFIAFAAFLIVFGKIALFVLCRWLPCSSRWRFFGSLRTFSTAGCVGARNMR